MTTVTNPMHIEEWKDGYDWYRRRYDTLKALLVELLALHGIDLAGKMPTRYDLVDAGLLPKEPE